MVEPTFRSLRTRSRELNPNCPSLAPITASAEDDVSRAKRRMSLYRRPIGWRDASARSHASLSREAMDLSRLCPFLPANLLLQSEFASLRRRGKSFSYLVTLPLESDPASMSEFNFHFQVAEACIIVGQISHVTLGRSAGELK